MFVQYSIYFPKTCRIMILKIVIFLACHSLSLVLYNFYHAPKCSELEKRTSSFCFITKLSHRDARVCSDKELCLLSEYE